LRDRRCKETEATIAAALDGNYQEEHLFELKVAVEMFDAYSAKIQVYVQGSGRPIVPVSHRSLLCNGQTDPAACDRRLSD
jgi:hypothetical protein